MGIDIPEETHGLSVLSGSGDTIVLKGEIDQNEPQQFLAPFFAKVKTQLPAVLIFDISEVVFLNSAAIGCILEFLIDRGSGSKVIIRIDRNLVWQRMIMEVITTLDPGNISLES